MGIKQKGKNRSEEIQRGEIFEVLSNKRRRLVLEYLKQNGDEGTDLRPLVEYVAAKENGTDEADLDSDARKRVYTALRQSHLPKLDDIGVIEYDNLRGEVALNETARKVQSYLDYYPDNPWKWSAYYLGLTVLASTMFLLYLIDVFPFGYISDAGIAILILVLFAIGSLAHASYTMMQDRKFTAKADHA